MTTIFRWCLILLALYAGFIAFLYFMQDSLVFLPPKITKEQWEHVAVELNGEVVTIRVSDDGVFLRGWFLGANPQMTANTDQSSKPTLLIFGGNGQSLADFAHLLDPLHHAGMNILLVDYRGYGFSGGKPSTEMMKVDAEILFDAAAKHPNVDPDHISVWGISIGTGIATHLASVRPVEKLILLSPFTSTVDVAARTYPFIPKPLIELLFRHKLDNLALAPRLTNPVLIIHGERDSATPVGDARRVAETWGGETKLLIVEGRGHDDVLADAKVWEEIRMFLVSRF